MPTLFLYLLKVNASLLLFYLAYRVLLRPLTFYTLNRLFLAFGIGFSLAHPLIDISQVLSQQQLSIALAINAPDWKAFGLISQTVQVPSLGLFLTFLFWAGVGLMTVRLLGQVFSLSRVHRKSLPACHEGFHYRQVDEPVNPFSFWRTIYLNSNRHLPQELTCILQHEQIHVRQWHTLDVLLGEATLLFCWFNPAVWLLQQAVKENLEFITDKQMLQSGVNSKAYQYHLVRISGLSQGSALVNNFNFLTLKIRIAMMNKKQSPLLHVARYVVLIPLIAAPMLAFTACSGEPETISPLLVDQQAGVEVKSEAAVQYYIDGDQVTKEALNKLAPNVIESINVLKGESAIQFFGDKAANGVITITTKKNQQSL